MLVLLTIAIIILLVVAFGWHLFLPLIGGAIAITGAVWGFLIAAVVVLSVAILLAFIFTGTGILVLGIFGLVWTVIAIALFPVIFPIIIPLFIILAVVSYHRSKQKNKNLK